MVNLANSGFNKSDTYSGVCRFCGFMKIQQAEIPTTSQTNVYKRKIFEVSINTCFKNDILPLVLSTF
jgi:hypothetical protein